ncbi:MAG TPA: F0F1 ATP synthase subunit A [Candidatus Paceibacterota bacterium]|nr:F0F1 ATP synthase subunit A [Candidatus Paceibacterota bacterium]
MEGGIHVAIAPEIVGHWFGLPITNTLLMSWIVVFLLAAIAITVGRKATLVPGKMQLLLELGVSNVFDFVADTLESRDHAKRYFPLIMTMFLFIFTANLLEFVPGVGSIGILANQAHEAAEAAGHGAGYVPLLRSMNTDLNMTLALAIISFLVIEISGIVMIGFFKYMSRFLPFHAFHNGIGNGIIAMFVGLIEFVSELIRLISFSFRLFGNIFAGEVLIAVMAFFVPFALPVPFMAFEVFVGFMQAAIFSLLTLFFIKLAITETAH